MIDVDQFKTRVTATAQNTAERRERQHKDWVQLRALCVASEFPEPMITALGHIVIYGPNGESVIDAPADTVYFELLGPANTR